MHKDKSQFYWMKYGGYGKLGEKPPLPKPMYILDEEYEEFGVVVKEELAKTFPTVDSTKLVVFETNPIDTLLDNPAPTNVTLLFHNEYHPCKT